VLFAPPPTFSRIYIFLLLIFCTFVWMKTAKSLLRLGVITVLQRFRLTCTVLHVRLSVTMQYVTGTGHGDIH